MGNYTDALGYIKDQRHANGETNADFEAGKCRLIMFARNDFENMVSKSFNYPKGLNGINIVPIIFKYIRN